MWTIWRIPFNHSPQSNDWRYNQIQYWGLDCDTDMSYVLELAQEEFETLKAEYPGTFDLIVIDAATPARFV